MVVAQVAPPGLDPASGSAIAYVGTFLLAALFYALTAHVAARYVLGEVPVQRALIVGPVLAFVALLLQQYGPAIVIVVSLTVDYFLIQAVYRLNYRTTGVVAVVHYTVAVIAGITVYNLVSLLATAPG